MAIHLNKGDRIWARPCVVTITTTVGAIAYGHCDVCETEHIIDRQSFEAGNGPWCPVGNGSEPSLCSRCLPDQPPDPNCHICGGR